MQLLQIEHNKDLKRLRDEGFEIEVTGGQILVHHIPYVNNARKIAYGVLVSELNQSNGKTLPPNTHVIFFIGDHPCNKDGSIMTGLQHNIYERNQRRLHRTPRHFNRILNTNNNVIQG